MEQFKPINGFENYGINRNGEIRNIKFNRSFKTFIHKKSGYIKARLCKDGKKKDFYIHRLVGLAFIPNPENKPTIDHIDRNKQNNNVSNLRWATQQEQVENTGVHKDNFLGEKNISTFKNKNGIYFHLRINRSKKKILNKYFNKKKYTLEDVCIYRDNYLKTID